MSWRDGVLKLQACGGCGRMVFYPRPICPHCWSDDLAYTPAAGRGTIISFSVVHRPNDPAFNDEVPIVLAEIELEEGVLMLARVIGCDAAAVMSGLRVELPPRDVAVRYPLPVFQPMRND
ncbi:MAG: OB-fold domain-containing protein [Hyphomicrobiaceae bacterium]